MRTTLDIPEKLLHDVSAIVKAKSRSKAVSIALGEFVKRRRRELLLSLRGRVDVEDTSRELEEAELGETKGHR
ncbi:MAG: type II toxin-antitoxin system VapB family antitoxin [Cryobacterium sp.]|jgi:metal-responsive CopG/Arc/MetJ family transcriptional regulator